MDHFDLVVFSVSYFNLFLLNLFTMQRTFTSKIVILQTFTESVYVQPFLYVFIWFLFGTLASSFSWIPWVSLRREKPSSKPTKLYTFHISETYHLYLWVQTNYIPSSWYMHIYLVTSLKRNGCFISLYGQNNFNHSINKNKPQWNVYTAFLVPYFDVS